MLNIEYEIKLNDDGSPYIHIGDDYDDKPEDKFMVIELTRYLLRNIINKKNHILSEQTIDDIKFSEVVLDKIGSELGMLIKENMEVHNELTINYARKYDMIVNTKEELFNIKYNGNIYNDKIIKRVEGLKILVYNENEIYELKDGIDNKNWVKI